MSQRSQKRLERQRRNHQVFGIGTRFPFPPNPPKTQEAKENFEKCCKGGQKPGRKPKII